MDINLDKWEAQMVYEIIQHYKEIAPKNPLLKERAEVKDLMTRLEDFLSDCGQEANQANYDHIEYTNWAE